MATATQQKIDVSARFSHYVDHIAPVWNALPAEIRGEFYVSADLIEYARIQGITARPGLPQNASRIALVASWTDFRHVRQRGYRAVYMEHGAGQTYVGLKVGKNSYVGGDRAGALAVLVPGNRAKELQLAANPEVPTYVIGCPKLDRYADYDVADVAPVAIAHHWNCRIAPETMSAWRHFRPGWKNLVSVHPGAIGHAHPRIWKEVQHYYSAAGLTLVPLFSDVLDTSSVLAVDNSSVLFEFAATGRPVVVMNDPRYRRDVHHGGRFWDWANVGVQVSRPEALAEAFTEALEDDTMVATRRQEVVSEVYGVPVGSATQAAVDVLSMLVEPASCT